MAVHPPTRTPWERDQERPDEGRAERLASWLIVYLAALLTSLALGGGAWAIGLAR